MQNVSLYVTLFSNIISDNDQNNSHNIILSKLLYGFIYIDSNFAYKQFNMIIQSFKEIEM